MPGTLKVPQSAVRCQGPALTTSVRCQAELQGYVDLGVGVLAVSKHRALGLTVPLNSASGRRRGHRM